MAQLISKSSPSQTKELGASTFLVGKSPSCHVQINDGYLSEEEFRITQEGDHHVVEQLSQTPLLVNGQPTQRTTLHDGDEITVLEHRFVYSKTGPSGAQTKPSIGKSFESPQRSPTRSAPEIQTSAEASFPELDTSVPVSSSANKMRLISGSDPSQYWDLGQTTLIGKGIDCDIRIEDQYLDDHQCQIRRQGDQMVVKNLGQTPLLINREQVDKHNLVEFDEITLLDKHFIFHIQRPKKAIAAAKTTKKPKTKTSRSPSASVFGKMASQEPNDIRLQSMNIVQTFEKLQRQQKRKYRIVIACLVLVALFAGSWALWSQSRMDRQLSLAQSIFYKMKSFELSFAQTRKEIDVSQEQIASFRRTRRQMEKDYEEFARDLGVYSEDLDDQERLIIKMARIFGECELNMTPGFVQEVKRYIREWQSKKRYRNAIQKAVNKGYNRLIGETMLANDLPPQFFYLALVESNFDRRACGPETYAGIAKGMWQFIPKTALAYGLHPGPLQQFKKFDSRDERHDVEKATKAAAKYLSFIYNTEAQASGLLVMASYNWGETRIRRRIREMPQNPRERNFWRLLTDYKIPQETYNYVFRIFSAAVIGEDPELFGFDFKNPLADVGHGV